METTFYFSRGKQGVALVFFPCFSSVFSARLSSWYVLRTSSWLYTCFSTLFWHKVAVLIPFGIVSAQEGRKIHFQAPNICLFSLIVVHSVYTVVAFLHLWWWNLNSLLRTERFQGVENTKTEEWSKQRLCFQHSWGVNLDPKMPKQIASVTGHFWIKPKCPCFILFLH